MLLKRTSIEDGAWFTGWAVLTGVGRRFVRDMDPEQPIDPTLAAALSPL